MIQKIIKSAVINFWYGRSRFVLGAAFLLSPLAWIYRGVIYFRSLRFCKTFSKKSSVPCIVIGNITLGGTGKTPMVLYLIKLLQKEGFKPGVVSRGYGGKSNFYPLDLQSNLSSNLSPKEIGDEPYLIFKKTGVPVVVSPNRLEAQNFLLAKHPEINMVLSDDGLSHQAMPRDIEIVMVDGLRKFGNGYCLPIGPLREPISRLNRVDFVVITGGNGRTQGSPLQDFNFGMTLVPKKIISLQDPCIYLNISDWVGRKINLISGIGNPERFENLIKQMGLIINSHKIFPDHHDFCPEDLIFKNNLYPILMTEKDAVKCQNFKINNTWFLEVEPQCSEDFEKDFLNKLKTICNHYLEI